MNEYLRDPAREIFLPNSFLHGALYGIRAKKMEWKDNGTKTIHCNKKQKLFSRES